MLGAICALFVYVVTVGSDQKPSTKKTQQAHSYAQQAKQPTFAVQLREAKKHEPNCAEAQKKDECFEKYRPIWAAEAQAKAADEQALYTWLGLGLLFFTLWATAWAARGAARAASASERALTELEQPFVVMDVVTSGISAITTLTRGKPERLFKIEGDGNLHYRFTAHGRTVAILSDVTLKYKVVRRGVGKGITMPRPIPKGTPPDRKFPYGTIASENVPHREKENLLAVYSTSVFTTRDLPKTSRLFFMGRYTYSDLFGGKYDCGFCFVFDPFGNKFVRYGAEQYNYAQKSKAKGPSRHALERMLRGVAG